MHIAIIAAILIVLFFGGGKVKAECYDIGATFGQSNSMTPGRGPQNDAFYTPAIDARIKQVGRYGANNMQVISIGETLADGQYFDDLEAWKVMHGHGMMVSFARRYIAKGHLAEGCIFLIVPAGLGATSVLEWNGKLNAKPESLLLYPDMKARIQYALSLPNSRLVYALISLGERDYGWTKTGTNSMTNALFGSELAELIARLRSDFPQDPPFPIVTTHFVETYDTANLTLKNQFERVLTDTPRNTDILGDVATTPGTTSNFDIGENNSTVHFNAASMTSVGGLRHYIRWWQCNLAWAAVPKTKCYVQPGPGSN